MGKEKTKVIFRTYPNGDVIALFPELAGTRDPSTCDSYTHVGQHSSAYYSSAHYPGVIRSTRLATFAEYEALHKELTGIGYRLETKTRDARAAMYNKRLAALKAREQNARIDSIAKFKQE